MRVVDQLPHPTFRIQLFHFGTNYLVEIEAGPMKKKSFNGMYQDWIATWPPKD